MATPAEECQVLWRRRLSTLWLFQKSRIPADALIPNVNFGWLSLIKVISSMVAPLPSFTKPVEVFTMPAPALTQAFEAAVFFFIGKQIAFNDYFDHVSL